MKVIEFTVPVRIESEMNRREHWTQRRKRFLAQNRAVYFHWVSSAPWPPRLTPWEPPFTITLTRIAPRDLDSDNLAGGFKAVRDQIADILNYDDGDKRITWVYAQEKGKPKEYAVRIRIETKGRE